MTVYILRPNSPSSAPCVAIIAGSIAPSAAPFAPSAPFSQNGSMSVGHPIGGANTTTMYHVTNNTLSDVYVPMSIETKDLISAHRGQPDHVPETIPYEAISGPKMGSDSFMERMDRPDSDRDNPSPRPRLFGSRIDVPEEKLDQNVGSGRKLWKREATSATQPSPTTTLTPTTIVAPVMEDLSKLCSLFDETFKSFHDERGSFNALRCVGMQQGIESFLAALNASDKPKFYRACESNVDRLSRQLSILCDSSTDDNKECIDFLFYVDMFQHDFSAYTKQLNVTPVDPARFQEMVQAGWLLCISMSREPHLTPVPPRGHCQECTVGGGRVTTIVLSILCVLATIATSILGWDRLCRNQAS